MKKTDILIGLAILVCFAIFVVASSLRDKSVKYQDATNNSAVLKTGCSDKESRETVLGQARQKSLRTLGEFESQCQSQVTNQVFYQVEFVEDERFIPAWKNKVVPDLQEFAKLGVEPVIVVKQSAIANTATVSAAVSANTNVELAAKVWSKALDEVLAAGVSPEMLKTWILFPEPNVPTSRTTWIDPKLYVSLVNATEPAIVSRFPQANFVLVFNAMTYEKRGFSWGDREYASWKPYFEGLKSQRIAAVGVVAFPWMPMVGEYREELTTPNEYIPRWLIQEATETLAVKNVWVVTGTFVSLYAQEATQQITVPAEIRKQWLDATVDVLKEWPEFGWTPTLVLTTQDPRSEEKAKSDWSYWGSDITANPDHKWAALEFIVALRQNGIPLLLSL